MVIGIESVGLGPIREQQNVNVGSAQRKPASAAPAATVAFSAEGQEASEVAQLAQRVAQESEVRAEMVAEAKQNLEEGTHRMQDVVRFVAARLTRYVDM
jgi:anti-sigma28 factor (negative regulator of flagellin synthesis)